MNTNDAIKLYNENGGISHERNMLLNQRQKNILKE